MICEFTCLPDLENLLNMKPKLERKKQKRMASFRLFQEEKFANRAHKKPNKVYKMLTALKQMKQALPGVAALSQGLRTSAHPATVTTQAVVHCFGANLLASLEMLVSCFDGSNQCFRFRPIDFRVVRG